MQFRKKMSDGFGFVIRFKKSADNSGTGNPTSCKKIKVVSSNTADCNNRNFYSLTDRSQSFDRKLCDVGFSGASEDCTAAYVVCSGILGCKCFFDIMGTSADDKVRPEKLTCFLDAHIRKSDMNTGSKIRAVIDDQWNIVTFTYFF